MDILLITPYFGGSHRAWAEGYAQNSRHHITRLALPARFWKWRMQGGALTLAKQAEQRNLHADLLLTTDMLNLPVFLALTRHRFHATPIALYCHENQLTYPLQDGEKRDLTYPMINWLSMLAADHVFFNSRYHMENWFKALPRMLKHFPDYAHTPHIPEIRAKSSVLPVGCALAELDNVRPITSSESKAPLILWNQRWEYDKAPHIFFQALDVLAAEGLAFEVALAGSNERQQPEEFQAARERLGERVIHFGRADKTTYRRLLWQADIVVSTAIHEFFGIAVVEAAYCNTFPILPNRLAYCEVFPEMHHDDCLYDDFAGLLTRLHWALTHQKDARQKATALRKTLAQYDWGNIAKQYDKEIDKALHQKYTV